MIKIKKKNNKKNDINKIFLPTKQVTLSFGPLLEDDITTSDYSR